MISLEYSVEALEAKGLFYNKQITVYVEGDDDVMFWSNVFNLAKVEAHIEDVGGNKEVNKKIVDILEDNASFIVACDSDHYDFHAAAIEHNQIIRTYGYSIENSMYNPINLEQVIQKLGKKPKKIKEDLEKWTESFSNNLYDLLVYDVANQIYDKGIKVFGDNCLRFLKNKSSIEVCNTKISNYIKSLEEHFTEVEINEVKKIIDNSPKKLWFHLKGHFITHGIINLIQHYVRIMTGTKCDISHDSLYALTIDCSKKWENRIDIHTIVSKIKKLKKSA